ncbi:MAG: ATP-binding protein [Myxococcales bacterium]
MTDPLRADVLARLLLVQAAAGQMPDRVAAVGFFCRGLEQVPGVASVHLEEPGEPSPPPTPEGPVRRFPVRLGPASHGLLVARLLDEAAFAPYEPHLSNMAFMLGVMLEERRQRQLLEAYRDELEQRVGERTRQLAAEKERLAVTLRSIGDGVVTTDTEGRVVDMNQVAEALTGHPLSRAAGRPLAEVFATLDETTRAPRRSSIEAALATGAPVAPSSGLLAGASDGRERVIADSAAPLRSATGETLGVVLVLRDVTEERRLNEQLQRMQRLDAVGALAGGIAHDFNNLLNGIFGFVELARERVADAEAARALDESLGVFARAKDLTRQLLTFSKGGAPVRRVAELGALVERSARFALSGTAVTCEFRLAPALVADVDVGQVGQVIDNLVRNACEALGGTGAIAVRCDAVELRSGGHAELPAGRYARITVTDDGPGIARDVLPRIFDPFFTTKETGTGLGLATAYSIVRKHGGWIDVESEPGRGSTFRVLLPAAEVPAATAPALAAASHAGSGCALVLEDDPSVRKVLVRFLQSMGYAVTAVADGHEAVAAAHEATRSGAPFAVAIMDLTVPGGLGGKDAVGQLRTASPTTLAVAASGYSADPVVSDPRAFGFAASLAKPFTRQDLAATLATLFAKKAP